MNSVLLKQLIRAKGLTYQSAADRCGISKVTLCKALAGADIKISTLRAIGKGLEVPPGALLRDVP